ncbi:NUDIX hydrolase [Lysinibacter sp. HNR]|uniref:NUDIX hydrolase n=1 Tax=Lysinibacter sp. HNR TaxID=3031408 RepID=UPI0024353632|nr:NUDIX hydrolase [Lysinibacter sp. HNR]WGD36533.1 NUDIX hydrolase [Lysinibacter sp. HNR]
MATSSYTDIDNQLAWSINSSKYVIRDSWISLRADTCQTPDGVSVSPYYILEYPDWVSIFAIDTNNNLLLTREYHHGAGLVALGLPGGAQEERDSDATAGAIRELREETGFKPGQLINLGWVWTNWGNHTNRIYSFLATNCTPSDPQKLDPSEAIRVKQVPLNTFRSEHLEQGYHRLNAMMALEYLQREREANAPVQAKRHRGSPEPL